MTSFATSFATWCQHTAIATAIRSALWPFPVLEILHIAGMVVVFGAILILNLRVFGLILRSEPVSQIAQDLTPLTLIGLGVLHRKVAIAKETQPHRLRLSAAVSLVLWASVVLAGLGIGVLS